MWKLKSVIGSTGMSNLLWSRWYDQGGSDLFSCIQIFCFLVLPRYNQHYWLGVNIIINVYLSVSHMQAHAQQHAYTHIHTHTHTQFIVAHSGWCDVAQLLDPKVSNIYIIYLAAFFRIFFLFFLQPSLLVIELVILFLTKTFCVRTMNCFVFVGIPSSFFSASLMNVFLFWQKQDWYAWRWVSSLSLLSCSVCFHDFIGIAIFLFFVPVCKVS